MLGVYPSVVSFLSPKLEPVGEGRQAESSEYKLEKNWSAAGPYPTFSTSTIGSPGRVDAGSGALEFHLIVLPQLGPANY